MNPNVRFEKEINVNIYSKFKSNVPKFREV